MFTGEQIRKKREKEGLSAEELAAKLGVKKANLYKWEKGHRPHSPEDYIVIEKWLNTFVETVPIRSESSDLKAFANLGLSWEEYAKKLEADKAWLQRVAETSLAAVLKGVEELGEGQKTILRFEEGLAMYLQASARIAQEGEKRKDTGNAVKKDGRKKGMDVH